MARWKKEFGYEVGREAGDMIAAEMNAGLSGHVLQLEVIGRCYLYTCQQEHAMLFSKE